MANAELRIPSTETPTFFNKDTLAGLGFSNVVGTIAALPVAILFPAAAVPTYLGVTGLGTAWAAVSSKRKMTEELVAGKKVEAPTLFNKEAAGYGLGVAALLGIAAMGLVAATGGSVSVLGIMGSTGGALSPFTGLVALGVNAAQFGALTVGTAYGAFTGKAHMQQDYDQVIESMQQKIRTQERTIERVREQVQDVAPEQQNKRSFADRIKAEREQANGLSLT